MFGEKTMQMASKTGKAKLQMINTKKEIWILYPTRIRRSGHAGLAAGS